MDASISFTIDPGSTAVQAHSQSEFVGRDQELNDLLDALGAAHEGRGRAILVGGEPGIGKSRLAAELSARAANLGCLSLWGRGWEDAGAPAYWPWIQALRTLIRATPRDDLGRLLGNGLADVAQVLPELAVLFDELPRKSGADSDSARFQLFDSTANLLRNAAAEKPLLIVLDDLHAADTPSILLLRFIVSQLNDMAVLVVGTYRDLELTPDHPLTTALSEMARERATRLMMLGGLGSNAVSDYISATANIEPDGLTVAAVWRETNGNPLFVGEAVRLLASEGRLNEVGDRASFRLAVPAGVRAVISRRIGHLGAAVGDALTIGAVIGPEFGVDVLRRTSDLSAADTLAALDQAVTAGLLHAVSGAPGRYRFSHDLVREALYGELSSAWRSTLHRRIGETLELLYPSAVDAHLAELAFHFGQATLLAELDPEGDAAATRRKTLDYARRAGNQATRSLAYEEAHQLYSIALSALPDDPGADGTPRIEVLLALGDADARAGELDRARTSFMEAAELAQRLKSGKLLARAALGYGGRHQWARAGHDTRLIPLIQDALALLGDEDEALRIRLLTRLAGAWRGDPTKRESSAALSKEAVELARTMDDDVTLQYALTGRFWATWWPENPEERDVLASEILNVGAATGDGERIAEGHLMRFLSLFERGLIADARRQVERLAEVIRETRQPSHLWLEPVNRTELALFAGDFPLAEALISDELRSTYHVTPGRDDVSAARMHHFLLRREQGRVAEVETEVRASARDFIWYPLHRAALALVLIELNRLDEARAVFNDLARDQFAGIFRDNEWLLGISLASDACVKLNNADAARVLYEQLLPFAGRHAIGHAEGSVGVIDQYLGALARVLGRYDEGEQHLVNAVALLDEHGGRPWAAHARHDLASLLRARGRGGDQDRATAIDAEALTTADALGMTLADSIRAATNGAVPSPSMPMDERPSPTDHGRFRREGDFWGIEFDADSFTVRDSKGMHHLCRLLRSPAREMHALDLVHSDSTASAARGVAAEGAALDAELAVGDPSDTGPTLDAQAKAAYRDRLRLIDEELAEAVRWNDPERVTALEDERDALVRELAAAVGLGNRDRISATSSAERARVSVTRAIRVAMERISDYSPALGSHLEATIRTGTFCAYVPDPRAPIEWET